MDAWARKTARLAQTGDYLDRLQEIYPVAPKARRVAEGTIQTIREAFQKMDRAALVKVLLRSERFPYDESYAKYLRADPGALQRNPKTVERICNILFGMGLEKIVEGVMAPKKANTGRGNEFKRWAKAHFKFADLKTFKDSKSGVIFLDAHDTELRDFANSTLNTGLAKRPDFVAKSGRKFVIGEAKFLGETGGNQRTAFRDAMGVAAHPTGTAIKVAVLDGVVWIKGSSFYNAVEASSVHIFSALLLKDFLGAVR